MAMLKARLYEIELQKQEAVIDAMNATKTEIGWGHQLRSYVLQPYQQVKDLRTGITSGNPTTILDEFLQASLAQRWVARMKRRRKRRRGNAREIGRSTRIGQRYTTRAYCSEALRVFLRSFCIGSAGA